jgi:hypothetical protein
MIDLTSFDVRALLYLNHVRSIAPEETSTLYRQGEILQGGHNTSIVQNAIAVFTKAASEHKDKHVSPVWEDALVLK